MFCSVVVLAVLCAVGSMVFLWIRSGWQERKHGGSVLLTLCQGNPLVIDGSPHRGSVKNEMPGELQSTSNAENLFKWWCHFEWQYYIIHVWSLPIGCHQQRAGLMKMDLSMNMAAGCSSWCHREHREWQYCIIHVPSLPIGCHQQGNSVDEDGSVYVFVSTESVSIA